MIAELPDGTELEFPDDTSPEIIQNTVKQYLGQQSQKHSVTNYVKNSVAQEGNDPLDLLGGLIAGVGDVITGMMPMAASGALAAGGALAGEDPRIARQAAHQAAADVYPSLSEVSKRFGYDPTQNTMYKGIMEPFAKIGEGIEATGELAGQLTGNKAFGENTKTALEMGMLALPTIKGKEVPKNFEGFKGKPEDRVPTKEEINAKIEEEIAANAPKLVEPPSTLELLPKDQYPEPLGNRTIDPNTKTVTTGMAEDVPTVDFPLRPEALENDRKFQTLQRDLLTERQILDDWKERGVDEASIKQQEQAVEVARQKLGDYLDQGYGAKTPSDLYGRSIYESGERPALSIEHGFDRNKPAKEGLSLVPKDEPKVKNDRLVRQDPFDLGKPEKTPAKPEVTPFETSKDIPLKESKTPLSLEETVAKTHRERAELGIDEAPVVRDLDFHERLRQHIEAGDYKSALDWVIKERGNSIEGQVAKLLRKLNDTDLKLGSKSNLATERKGVIKAVGGAYIPNEHAVAIDALSAGNLKTFIHEAVHSATSAVLNRVLSGDTKGLSVRERIAGKNIVDLYNGIKNKTNSYGFKNAKEFVAEVFGNPAFRKELAEIKMEGTTAWQRFADNVRNLVGMDKRYDTALNRALFEGKRLIKASERSTRMADIGKETKSKLLSMEEAPPNKLDRFKSFDEFKKSLSPDLQKYAAEYWVENGRELPKEQATALRNEAQARAFESLLQNDERIKYLTQDTRSAEEIKGVILNHKDDINKNAFRDNLASGGFALSNLVKHPLVHWITSKTMKALKEAEIASERAISENGKGFLAILKGGTAEMQRDLSVKLRAIEGKDQQVQLTPWEQRVADSWNKAKKDALEKFNAARQAKGLTPVAPRMNYLASMFNGDMRVLVQKDGKTVGWITGNSRIELDAAMKKLDGEGYTFSPVERIPHARSRDFQKSIARRMAAFDEVIKILGEQDPDVKAFSDRMEASFTKQAYDYLDFKQHFKEKSGVFGAEGMKSWKNEFQNSNDLWNAQAEYIRAMHQWVAQQSIEPQVKQILSDPQLRKHSPNAMHLATQIYDNAFGRGKDTLQLFERFSDLYSELVNSDIVHAIPGVRNLQRVNPFEAARATKNWILYSALALNPGFMVSQAMQVPAATSTMMTYFHELGFKGNFTAALFHGSIDALANRPGMKELSNKIAQQFGEKLPNGFKSDVADFFNDYATENHVVTPHIMDKTELKSKIMLARGVQTVDHIASDSISKLEEGTRRWAFNTLAHYLYDSGLPKEKAAEMAEIATSIAMVDYSRQGRAMVYNKLGMLGDMAATVTSFKHNAFTQLFTYASSSAPKTLMMMLSIQAFLGGLRGMYAIDEVDQIWKLIQRVAPETFGDFPGVKEFIMRELPEALAFGGVSAGSRIIMPEGIDIGSKFSMDNAFPDSLSEALFPLMSTLTNTIQAAGKAKNAPTFENIFGVAYPMMPAPGKGLMENFLYSDDKGNFISPKTDQVKTNRSTNEKILRGLGMRSLDEAKESEITFRTKAKRLREAEQQKQALANIRSYARSGDPKGIAKNVVKYIEGGGTATQVNNFLIGAAGDRVQSEIQRLSPKTLNTIKQQMQAQDLQQFRQDTEN